MALKSKLILPFRKIGRRDGGLVGGKNANLGEMICKTRVPVPDGFAITSHAYKLFLKHNKLEARIKKALRGLDTHNMKQLHAAGSAIREMIVSGEMPPKLECDIMKHFRRLGAQRVAVRSSATAEDLPDASFAGQQETYLNVSEAGLIEHIKKSFASLFTDRAISYRVDKGFNHFKVFLSTGIQKMINSKCSGVIFTLDPDTGWNNVIVINGSWGLGDYIVQGVVTPDEFTVFKPTLGIIEKSVARKKIMEIRRSEGVRKASVPKALQNKQIISDSEIKQLARYAIAIEKHYARPMDIEWAKGSDGRLYILQARAETVQSLKSKDVFESYALKQKSRIIATGQAIGRKIGAGKANVIMSPKNISRFKKGEVLVTEMTDPDWEPLMKIASAIVTEKGGRTSHAAIVSRELGIPAVIGVELASRKIRTGQPITVDCSSEPGRIWSGVLKFSVMKTRMKKIPKTRTKILVNIGIPEEAIEAARLPVDGVGLAREEFIINSFIREHPLAMIKQGRSREFVEKLAFGIAKLVAPFYPRSVVLRFSDFKTNEYANLKGGRAFEPTESNPMIGWRGASRYVDPIFEPAFRLECRALKKVREEFGLTNVQPMIPFCRTIDEAKRTIEIMKSEGLARGSRGLQYYVMAEIPSNIVLVDEFNSLFDCYSIGSNDLTQLTLGLDRDSEKLARTADERNLAVLRLIAQLIKGAHAGKKAARRKVGICGQAPSDFPEVVKFLVKHRIDSISVNPDVAVKVKLAVAKLEKSSHR